MSLIEYKIPYKGTLPSCDDRGEATVGEERKFIPDRTKNFEWPDRIKSPIISIVKDPTDIIAAGYEGYDRIYVFHFDSEDFAVGTGQQTLDSCSFTDSMECWECCDENEPRIAKLEACSLDTRNAYQVFRPDYVAGTSQISLEYVLGEDPPALIIITYTDSVPDIAPDQDDDIYLLPIGAIHSQVFSTHPPETGATAITVGECKTLPNLTDNADGTATWEKEGEPDICVKTCEASDANVSHLVIAESPRAILDVDIPLDANKEVDDTVIVTWSTTEDVIAYTKVAVDNWTESTQINQSVPVTTFTTQGDGSTDIGYKASLIDTPITPVNVPPRATLGGVINGDGSSTFTFENGDGPYDFTTALASAITENNNGDGSMTYTHTDGNGNTAPAWTVGPTHTTVVDEVRLGSEIWMDGAVSATVVQNDMLLSLLIVNLSTSRPLAMNVAFNVGAITSDWYGSGVDTATGNLTAEVLCTYDAGTPVGNTDTEIQIAPVNTDSTAFVGANVAYLPGSNKTTYFTQTIAPGASSTYEMRVSLSSGSLVTAGVNSATALVRFDGNSITAIGSTGTNI